MVDVDMGVNPKIVFFSPQIIPCKIPGFHGINHPFWGGKTPPMFGNTHMRK